MSRSLPNAALAIAFALFCTLGAVIGVDAQQAPRERALPKTWTGEFRWDNSPQMSEHYDIAFTSIQRSGANQIEALGCGLTVGPTKAVTQIAVRMVLDTATRKVEIFESDAVGSPNFTTDGSHKGDLASDLQSIRARWTTRSNGMQGTLSLHAGGDLTCAAPLTQ